MQLEYGMRTDTGRVRSLNEDACAVAESGEVTQFAIVCDGMGGHQAGEIAADLAVRTVVEAMYRDENMTMLKMRRAIEIANARVFRHANTHEGCAGMGTTLVLAVLEKHTVNIANVGDSRAYHFSNRNQTLQQISKDHSLVEELLQNGQLSEKDAEEFPFRNIITRAVGSGAEVKVDLFEKDWEPDDILLLCSDGMTRHLSDAVITQTVSRALSAQALCDELVWLANEDGGRDNITVVIVRYGRGGDRP